MSVSDEEVFNLQDWYNPKEAAERLSANSGKSIDMSYVRTLARYGKIRSYQISDRVRLYRKEDIDKYVVEERGEKSARAKRRQALNNKNQQEPPKSKKVA